MLAYNFNEQGFFISKKEAKKDPLESVKESKDIFLLPKNSTFKKPLKEKEGFNVIYESNTWIYEEIPKPPKPKEPTLIELKEVKINEAKQKRNNNLANYVLTEGILKTNNIAETFMVLERYAKNLEQGKILAKFGLEDEVLVKLTKNIIVRWIETIEAQYNQSWIDYRLLVKKINATKTITTLNKIEIK